MRKCVMVLLVALPLLQGCATTGSIPAQIITQSAAVDTSISDLQDQQTTTIQAAEQITATADAIEQTADVIKDSKLTGQIVALKTQVKTLNDSLKAERDKVLKIQSDYTLVKTSAGTELSDKSAMIIKQAQQIQARTKWIFILAGIIIIHVLLDAAVITKKLFIK